MDREPTPRITGLLQVGTVVFFVLLGAPSFIVFLGGTALLLLMSRRFRAHLFALVKLTFGVIFFLGLVSIGRIVGGQSETSEVLHDAVLRLSLVLLLMFLGTVLFLYSSPEAWLRVFDRLRLPRSLSYLLLSVLTLQVYLRHAGRRQLYLLGLKGLGVERLQNRLLAYYRIAGPIFWSTLSRQIIHARSLHYRGFFEAPCEIANREPASPERKELIWTSLFLGYWLLWLILYSRLNRFL